MNKLKLYTVTGMLYCPSGWEFYSDCIGSIVVRGYALAKRIAKAEFYRGGYGADGKYIEASAPSIREFNPKWDYLPKEGAVAFYNDATGEIIYE